MNLDWSYMIDQIPLYKKALILTIKLAFWGILLSTIIGLICSIIQYFKVKVLCNIVQGYIELSRNTPLLIQLFFLYYGLPKMGITIEAELCAIIGLAFLGGSYMTEALRAGIEAVPVTQIETGKAIGLSNSQLIRYILLPQAVTSSVPALGANCIFLLKETSIFSGIAILELTNTTKDLIGMFYKTNESLLMLVIGYLIILLPMSLLLSWLERRVRHAEFGY
ncbi:amino acid ABC transporter permease [Viridibacillus sp. NPDC096237]|uniref:amino acid ABC transporter permease n=1 Tax=Viridibacillus sp. NPDC096237 TaxID=3390721 RepID=UPI003CFE3C76